MSLVESAVWSARPLPVVTRRPGGPILASRQADLGARFGILQTEPGDREYNKRLTYKNCYLTVSSSKRLSPVSIPHLKNHARTADF